MDIPRGSIVTVAATARCCTHPELKIVGHAENPGFGGRSFGRSVRLAGGRGTAAHIYPDAEFFGCTGPRLRAAGVRTVVDAASLAVVGLWRWSHISRGSTANTGSCWRAAPAGTAGSGHSHRFAGFPPARGPPAAPAGYSGGLPGGAAGLGVAERPRSDDAPHHPAACSVSFRSKRISSARTELTPTYIGHPLAGLVRPSLSRDEFFRKHRLACERPLIAVLPGSRRGEAARHLPVLLDAVDRMYREQAVNLVLPASVTTGAAFFEERIGTLAHPGH